MSTYSTNLALELIANGDQSGTWGTTTNTNLGTLIEQAISGYVTQACTGGTDTITIPNGTTGVARNMFLELTGTGGGTLVVPSNKKLYFIYNNTSTAITVKVSGQTGVSVPAGKKTILVSNGTDIIDATNYVTALAAGTLAVTGAVTLSTALSAANGGTGLSSPGTAGNILTSTGSTWQSSPASTFVSNVTATSPLASTGGNTPDISLGTVPVSKGGTGATSATAYAVLAGGTTSTGAFQSVASVGTSGQVLTSNGAGALPSFQAVGVGGGTEYKTSGSGTWTIPAGVTTVTVTVLGPGANGGRGQYANTGGGGAGGLAIKTLTSLTPGNTLSYVVGTTTGGVNSTVSSGSQTITGGYGAQPGDSSATGGTGGTASGGDLNIPGQKGYDYEATGSQYDCAGGSPGGGFGFGGRVNGSTGTYGNGATGYGAGGGGNNAGATGVVRGGDGTAGLVIFQY
jgi:hypothetical protein